MHFPAKVGHNTQQEVLLGTEGQRPLKLENLPLHQRCFQKKVENVELNKKKKSFKIVGRTHYQRRHQLLLVNNIPQQESITHRPTRREHFLCT